MAVQAGIQVSSSPWLSHQPTKLSLQVTSLPCQPVWAACAAELSFSSLLRGWTWLCLLIIAPPLGQSEPAGCTEEEVPTLCTSLFNLNNTMCRHLSPTRQLWRPTCVPACRLVFVMNVCCSDPEEFPPHTFLSGRNAQCFCFFFLFPYHSQQRSVTHPKSQNNTCIVLHICHMAAPPFSAGWFGKSWLCPLVSDWRYAKYVSRCCVDNMWQETSDWCRRVDEAVDELWLDAAASDTLD